MDFYLLYGEGPGLGEIRLSAYIYGKSAKEVRVARRQRNELVRTSSPIWRTFPLPNAG